MDIKQFILPSNNRSKIWVTVFVALIQCIVVVPEEDISKSTCLILNPEICRRGPESNEIGSRRPIGCLQAYNFERLDDVQRTITRNVYEECTLPTPGSETARAVKHRR